MKVTERTKIIEYSPSPNDLAREFLEFDERRKALFLYIILTHKYDCSDNELLWRMKHVVNNLLILCNTNDLNNVSERISDFESIFLNELQNTF